MENFEYSKTFPLNNMRASDFISSKDDVKNFLQSYEGKLKDSPRILLPYAPAIFEKTIQECEQIAKEFSGRIKAKIDYSRFIATIELWCPYVEFNDTEFMSILHTISHLAKSVRITPLTSGELHIKIWMPYFASEQEFLGLASP